jgi:hypothetical protein
MEPPGAASADTGTFKEIARCSFKVEPLAESQTEAVKSYQKLSLLLKKDRKTRFLQKAKGSDTGNQVRPVSFIARVSLPTGP